MACIGYARVSTDDQNYDAQVAELTKAGCALIFKEQASGGNRSRAELAQALRALQPGDTLIVSRIDRLARSLIHLMEIVEDLDKRGVTFRSLHDPIDTASPQGKFALQMLGSMAEFERALIRERTLIGLKAAREQGRVGGNPGLVARDPEAMKALQAARNAVREDAVLAVADDIVPVIYANRPGLPWGQIADELNRRGIKRHDRGEWDTQSLIRAARRLEKHGHLGPAVFDPSRPTRSVNGPVMIVASVAKTLPNPTLTNIVKHLKALGCKTPRGHADWSTSSVQNLLQQAVKAGLLEDRPLNASKRGRPPKSIRLQNYL